MMMEAKTLNVRVVNGRAEADQFLRFAWEIYRDYPAWVPPLLSEQRQQLDRQKNPFFKTSSAEYFLAWEAGQIVGRIAAIKNGPHLDAHADGVGFFGFFETVNRVDVARALLAAAETWLRAQGLRVMRGPANLSIYEEAGVVIEGGEHQPMAGMGYTPPYYASLLEQAGYVKAKDLYVYRLDPQSVKANQVDRLAAAAARRGTLGIRTLDMRRLREEAAFLANVYAQAWRENWGQVPISEDEFYDAYKRYRFFIDPQLVYLATADGDPAGYFVAMPDMNGLLKTLNGRIGLLGLWRLWTGRKKITRYRIFMTGVKPEYRRLGIPLVFLSHCKAHLLARRATLLEFSWVLEDNHETIAIIERLGCWRAQTLRLYEKPLA
jgi:GNAT superfamily N-acetyltransferase